MSTVSELFAPKFLQGRDLTPEIEQQMADALGADSLHYLPLDAISRCVDMRKESLCQACIDGKYPTPAGRRLYQIALSNSDDDSCPSDKRTYDVHDFVTVRT